jgi:hypothetical protein
VSDPRHAIVSVVFGPDAPRRVVVRPGEVLGVGSGKGAELCLTGDPELGKLHFRLAWDGARAELRSVEPQTLLDGLPVDITRAALRADAPNIAGEVRHGSWIRAGTTVFMLHHEARTPPPARAQDPARAARAREALRVLGAARGLYGVLDAARSPRVGALLRESIDEGASLYEGVQGQALADVAPYLVRFEPGSRLLGALVEEGWGDAWGIYLTARIPVKELRRHLRHFLIVEEETTGDRLYFRFYDPRTLRDFLPRATPKQESELFGDVGAFLCEGPDGELLRFRRGSDVSDS